MAFADDAVRAKLSALNETQDSIVSVAQWILFHRRHADRTAELWLERLKDSNTSKKLNLIYLANEVVQQSKARKKEDFHIAFSPIIADATATAYKGSVQEVQQKIRRVVEVWRERNIFDRAIQEAIERRIDDIDKTRANRSGNARLGGGGLGGSLFSAASASSTIVPAELQALVQPQTSLTKSESAAKPLVTNANTEYAKMSHADTPLPTPPVHAARLSSLLKTLAGAETAVNDSIKTRQELIAGLEKLLASNKSKLAEEETTRDDLSNRRTITEAKKKEVEDGIMRGLSTETFNAALPGQPVAGGGGNGEAPETEAFTPPPPEVEDFTPPASPNAAGHGREPEPDSADPADHESHDQHSLDHDTFHADLHQEQQQQQPTHQESHPSLDPTVAAQSNANNDANGTAAEVQSLLATLAQPTTTHYPAANQHSPADPRLKRRKTSHKPSDMDEDLFGSGEGVGIDQDVAAMLGAQ